MRRTVTTGGLAVLSGSLFSALVAGVALPAGVSYLLGRQEPQAL